MEKKSDLLIVTKAKELCAYMFKVTQKSPKQFRFTFVSRLQNLSLDVIENIYYGDCGFFLKCDVQKYFEAIDHAVLKNKLEKIFGLGEIFELLCRIIDSYETAPGRGLPLGNQTSQWFALLYLDTADRLIKEKLRIKYYVRYMDDFILLHHDKNYLQNCLREIKSVFHNDLFLELNSKTQIFPVKNGVKYLGWHYYMTDSGKVVRKLLTSGKRRIKRRFGKLQKNYAAHINDLDDIKRSLASTRGHLIHGHTFALRRMLWNRQVLRHNPRGTSECDNYCGY